MTEMDPLNLFGSQIQGDLSGGPKYQGAAKELVRVGGVLSRIFVLVPSGRDRYPEGCTEEAFEAGGGCGRS